MVEFSPLNFSFFLGPNPDVTVFQLQPHSPYPTGSFDLVFNNFSINDNDPQSSPLRASIPWDASGDTVESLIEATFPDDLVNVSRASEFSLFSLSHSCHRWRSLELVGVSLVTLGPSPL
jgi:hypothetical protein